jgi:hypothetical protein
LFLGYRGGIEISLNCLIHFLGYLFFKHLFTLKYAKGDDGAKNAMRSPHIPQEMLSEESVAFNKLFPTPSEHSPSLLTKLLLGHFSKNRC